MPISKEIMDKMRGESSPDGLLDKLFPQDYAILIISSGDGDGHSTMAVKADSPFHAIQMLEEAILQIKKGIQEYN